MGRQSDARDRILGAAVELIYARSYGAVGVQEICERAGVKKGSFYHFFPSKRELTMAALDALAERIRQRILDPAFANDLPPLERIKRFFDLGADIQGEYQALTGHVLGCPVGNLALEISTQDETLRKHLERLLRGPEERIAATLEEAKRDGSAPGIDPARAARAIFAYMEGALLMAKTRNDAEVVRELGRGAVALATAATAEPEAVEA